MARGSRDPRENEQAMMMSPARKRWWRSDYNIPHLWGFTPTIVCTRLVSCLLGVTGFALRVLLTEDQNNTRTNLSLPTCKIRTYRQIIQSGFSTATRPGWVSMRSRLRPYLCQCQYSILLLPYWKLRKKNIDQDNNQCEFGRGWCSHGGE